MRRKEASVIISKASLRTWQLYSDFQEKHGTGLESDLICLSFLVSNPSILKIGKWTFEMV